jgi:hypothetical protein
VVVEEVDVGVEGHPFVVEGGVVVEGEQVVVFLVYLELAG